MDRHALCARMPEPPCTNLHLPNTSLQGGGRMTRRQPRLKLLSALSRAVEIQVIQVVHLDAPLTGKDSHMCPHVRRLAQ